MKNEPLEVYKMELKDLEQEDQANFIKINCPSCGSEVGAPNLSLDQKLGKCGSCNAVFSIAAPLLRLHREPKKVKQKIIRPEGIDLFSYGGNLEFSMNQPMNIWEAMFLIFFPLIGVFGIIGALSSGVPLAAGFFAIIGLLLPLIYFNRWKSHKIFINIDDRFLNLNRRPKKLKKDIHVEIADIDQLYISKVEYDASYYLKMIVNSTEGQKHLTLITGLKSISKARYLEQEIERHLNIVDREVPEEV